MGLALKLLLATTTGSAWLRLSAWNSVVNFGIAAAEVLRAAVFFMHLRHAGGLVRLVAGVALFMLVPLFGLAAGDFLHCAAIRPRGNRRGKGFLLSANSFSFPLTRALPSSRASKRYRSAPSWCERVRYSRARFGRS